MNILGQRQRPVRTLAVVAILAWAGLTATVHAAPVGTEKSQVWSVANGTVGVRWNRELAQDLGLVLGAARGRYAQLSWYEHEVFDLRPGGGIDFDVRSGSLHAFLGGSLQARGGYAIDSKAGRIDLTDFRLVPRPAGTSPTAANAAPTLDIVGADGKAWFYVDRLMYELIDGKQRLAVRTMDLRITAGLAQRLGHPEAAGWVVADMELTTDVQRQGVDPAPPRAGSTKWHGTAVPGVPGAVYQADLFMTDFSVQYTRCNACTGEGGSGSVVFSPSSVLRNNVNNGTAQPTVAGDPLGTSDALYAADIPWYTKFSGNFAPYNNDQHPYLIWNLYRFNPDGSLDQIGRSGAKHGFLTLNTTCLDNPADNHILGRGCSDVYSVSNNDNNNSLGPRAEIIAQSNRWGRCGSIYDTNCDGVANTSGNGLYDHRLQVRESQFSGPTQAGATYLFESWYLAREDVNIFNSMATKRATFTRNGTLWSVGGNDQYKLGPAIDRWVDPAAPGADAASVLVSTSEGKVKVAVKVTKLGRAQWRYDYAVMNLDFARAATEGTEPNLRVVKNLGFDNFSVPIGESTVTDLVFGDGDLDPQNDWTGSIRDGRLTWYAAVRSNALNWGTLFRFSFVSNQAPVASTVTLHIAADNTRETLPAAGVLAPATVVSRTAASSGNAAR